MATTPHVVRISEVGKHVREVIENLNADLWEMNQRGHFIEMPDEISFEMVVLKEFEALTSTDTEISEGSETQGGYSTENSKTTGSERHEASETKRSNANNSHNNSGVATETFKGS